MQYIIMADGAGNRWNNHGHIPKHLIEINGETLLQRTVRLIREVDFEANIIITSRDIRYEVLGAMRYEPQNNILEIDRFTNELITDDICFLYGDTIYKKDHIEQIVQQKTEEILFFGNNISIAAVKVKNSELFRRHIDIVREKFLNKEIDKCIGWQVYQSYTNQPYNIKTPIKGKFYLLEGIYNINTPDDFTQLVGENK